MIRDGVTCNEVKIFNFTICPPNVWTYTSFSSVGAPPCGLWLWQFKNGLGGFPQSPRQSPRFVSGWPGYLSAFAAMLTAFGDGK